MADKGLEAFIKKTQETLGKIITKPKMTEERLRKPPFAFLHDAISEVIRTRSFAPGLFTPQEMICDNVKSKEGKIAYLNKIINCVGIALSMHCPARPAKIITGQDPKQTNMFLVMLAKAAVSRKIDVGDAVRRTLAGESQPAPAGGAAGGGDAPARAAEAADDGAGAPAAGDDLPAEPPAVTRPKAAAPAPAPAPAAAEDTEQHDGGSAIRPATTNTTGVASRRPTSAARPGPPKKRPVSSSAARPQSGKKAAEGLIGERGAGDDDDDAFVVEEAAPSALAGSKPGGGASGAEGALVQELRDAERKMAGAAGAGAKAEKPPPARTSREQSRREVESVREAVQTLVRNVNPLGKLMDYVEEDMDAMAREMRGYAEESRGYEDALEAQRRMTQESLRPLESRLAELDEQIVDQIGRINALKATIMTNDQQIQQLLRTVVVR